LQKELASFDPRLLNQPAFVVITGDLVEWGGGGVSGRLNYQTLVSCFYENEGQFYIDSGFSPAPGFWMIGGIKFNKDF